MQVLPNPYPKMCTKTMVDKMYEKIIQNTKFVLILYTKIVQLMYMTINVQKMYMDTVINST